MAETVILHTTFQLRRGLSTEWAEKNPILATGEPGFETNTGKLKIGNGISAYNELPYISESSGASVIKQGYYLNNKFYTDSTYTIELVPDINSLYVDNNTNGTLYTYNGQNYECSVKPASEFLAGIMKLYIGPGQNIDGTMTQKAITDGINAIKFSVEDTDDDGESDCLILDLPWD